MEGLGAAAAADAPPESKPERPGRPEFAPESPEPGAPRRASANRSESSESGASGALKDKLQAPHYPWESVTPGSFEVCARACPLKHCVSSGNNGLPGAPPPPTPPRGRTAAPAVLRHPPMRRKRPFRGPRSNGGHLLVGGALACAEPPLPVPGGAAFLLTRPERTDSPNRTVRCFRPASQPLGGLLRVRPARNANVMHARAAIRFGRFFLGLSRERILKRYCHNHPTVKIAQLKEARATPRRP